MKVSLEVGRENQMVKNTDLSSWVTENTVREPFIVFTYLYILKKVTLETEKGGLYLLVSAVS